MSEFVNEVAKALLSVRALFTETPLQYNAFLSKKYNAEIYLKREDLTPVRSYKIRGAFNFISQILNEVPEDTAFVCASAGNHAQGLAYACRHFNRHGVIFMPVTTPQQKVDKTRAFGGDNIEIRQIGDTFDQCYEAAQAFVTQGGGVMAPPFDDLRIIIGQATLVAEITKQWNEMNGSTEPDMIIAPVGGGGLGAGIVRYIHELGWKTKILFAEPEGAASLFASLTEGHRVKLEDVSSFVDGAAVAQIGKINFDILKDFSPFDVLVVPENRLCTTMVEMLNIEGVVLEPAGALSIDALKNIPSHDLKGKKVILIISGSNFDFERLPEVKERALRFQGLKKYFIFRFPQRPGALRSFLDQLGPEDDVARFEYLKKSARNFGSVLIAIESKHSENFVLLEEKFKASGWAYRDITNDQVLSDFVI